MKRASRSSKRIQPASDGRTIIPVQNIVESINRRELVAIIGTGVSVALTNGKFPAYSWRGLIENGYAFAQRKSCITAAQASSWKDQLSSSDTDELLAAAEFLSRKLHAPSGDLYARWLEEALHATKPLNKALAGALVQLQEANIPICTLNYDTLLEDTLGQPSIDFSDTFKVTNWVRREEQGILHLHGVWNKPSTCMLGIRDYSTALLDQVRDLLQKSLGAFRRLLFIGCGDTFSDPNFTPLVQWLRQHLRSAGPQHYGLVLESEIAARNADPSWQGFVEPLSYGAQYNDLPGFLIERILSSAVPAQSKLTRRRKPPLHTSLGSQTITAYRRFLLKDCGQMTIEGVRTDIEMAQRFDIERLFVPLQVSPIKPEALKDAAVPSRPVSPETVREAQPVSFGRAFRENQRLALLALPGGGKTLLLKRLAVAYSDETRRRVSNDQLPPLTLTPLLIRCREWREHIHLPIATLLRKIPEITGQESLRDLSTALKPLLRAGSVLLLVDGLDEIHDDSARATFVDNLESFLREHDKIRFVVTSREAGFSLVAPSISRFCTRFRLAPLQTDAIAMLCEHWHRLMSGGTPESIQESKEVASTLLRNPALHRLAENPLLLTMLLVVKHGAGRLPPDRVSLYERAVEVLLDTWNIKGHEALNVKEAVPQLAFVAFRLLMSGKQTATEKELLSLLDESREAVPQIRRYARGTSFEFIKRVELRSSLVLEGGHQLENGRPVPFYQFRHLTFQEYLAAVAAVEGHYIGYKTSDTVLTPLNSVLINAEWKEVIPMAAVLSGKQAEPLIASLVSAAEEPHPDPSTAHPETYRRESPIARLLTCLTEEAEASPDTLRRAQRVLLMSHLTREREGMRPLARGPYGAEILQHAYDLFADMKWTESRYLPANFMHLGALSRPSSFWNSPEGLQHLRRALRCGELKEQVTATMTLAGTMWGRDTSLDADEREELQDIVDTELIYTEEVPLYVAAAWERGWYALRNPQSAPKVSRELLERVFELWKHADNTCVESTLQFCLCMHLGLERDFWHPNLGLREIERFLVKSAAPPAYDAAVNQGFAIMLAFHSGLGLTQAELAAELAGLANTDLGRHIENRLPTLGNSLGVDVRARRRRKQTRLGPTPVEK